MEKAKTVGEVEKSFAVGEAAWVEDEDGFEVFFDPVHHRKFLGVFFGSQFAEI